MPYYLRALTSFGPFTLPVDALRSVMLRGWSINYIQVVIGYLNSLLYSITVFVMAVLVFNRNTSE